MDVILQFCKFFLQTQNVSHLHLDWFKQMSTESNPIIWAKNTCMATQQKHWKQPNHMSTKHLYDMESSYRSGVAVSSQQVHGRAMVETQGAKLSKMFWHDVQETNTT